MSRAGDGVATPFCGFRCDGQMTPKLKVLIKVLGVMLLLSLGFGFPSLASCDFRGPSSSSTSSDLLVVLVDVYVKSLWEVNDKVGKVADVYVARKLSKIELVSLPCCAWNDVAVKKLATKWGDVCFLEEDGDDSLAVKRVCIKTGKPSLIHDMNKVVAQGIEYGVVRMVIRLMRSKRNLLARMIRLLMVLEELVLLIEREDFFQTTTKRKGNGAVDGGLYPPNVAATRDVVENQCKPVVPAPVRVVECELSDGPSHLVANVEGEGASESPSQHPGFR
ncbi:unnamed protein product [Lactuca virosa]|uniref:DUF4283 domain-containing protein n=1 Tax=Lactuca virosa TaxID=75947 RepID=A0AAU9LR46_9ASTR|nr:unnamed protein product [Lactuca virosa]